MTPPTPPRIEPLPPPPDSFDKMLRTARGRRRRQAVAVVSSAAALVLVASGAFALGNEMGRNNVTAQPAAANAGRSAASAASASTTVAASSPTRHRKHKRPVADDRPAKVVAPPAYVPPTQTTTVTAHPSTKPIIQLRGRVTDPEGNPLAGVYVLPGSPDSAAFAPHNGAYAQTDEHGEFSIPCPRSPVYLATWPINRPITSATIGADYAPVWFGAPQGSPGSVVPTCGRERKTAVMQPVGATVEGTVMVSPLGGSCAPGRKFAVGIWLGGKSNRSVRINGLDAGTRFSFAGLPVGTHTLNAAGTTATVTVIKGAGIVEQNAVFTCHGTGTPDPTSTPDPAPTPTTPTPTPSTPAPSFSATP